ncbi:hypothetical protein PHMEG_00034640, partial [Phytophthora megakarya]
MEREEEDEDSDDEEETQIPIEDQMTQELRDTSPPPVHRRSSPTSPPLPMTEAQAGSPTGPGTGPVAEPPAASLSPFADAESTTPQSNEDEDSRSETSSEVSLGSGRTPRRRGARKRVTTPCSDHRNLSERLKKAVGCDGEENFGENMIGADVVLCVRRREVSGNGKTASNGNLEGMRRFHAHRFVLAASSPPFRAMLTGNMRESSRRDVELHDIEPVIVEKMLLFMYTGDVVLDLESV